MFKLLRLIKYILTFIIAFQAVNCLGQVEHVPVTHPVYNFLEHAEIRGLLPHFSSTELPLQRSQIVEALKQLRKNEAELNGYEKSSLETFETEFEIRKRENAVIFLSKTDTTELLIKKIFSDDEKFIYHYKDSLHNVSFSPLGSIEAAYGMEKDSTRKVGLGNLGFRLFGTLGRVLGYNLQVTNGSVLTGDKYLLLEDRKYQQNVKFSELNSDFDFTESHIRYQQDWFYGIIGRESRYLGSGINQRMFISLNAPPMNALSLGARFEGFEYRFTHFDMLGLPDSGSTRNGASTRIPSKYMALHRFAIKPEWGEIAYEESVIYTDRPVELAYLNPLSFLKSIEHSLHDRDNAMMGLDFTIRPIRGLQFKGSWLLDDIVFSKIGTGFWSNKTAWNFGFITSLPFSTDLGFEYARVEPYTFTHFNIQNSMTNDGMTFGTYLLPNSDEYSFLLQFNYGMRYPLILKGGYQRHGANILDGEGKLIKNAGGDPLQVRRSEDPETVTLLDGTRQNTFYLQLQGGYELIRGFNLKASYLLKNTDGKVQNIVRLMFSYEDF